MAEIAISVLIFILLAVFGRDIRKYGLRGMLFIALLVALASVGRAAFAAVPSMQPASFVIIMCGMAFGPGGGLVCGVLTAVLSSLLTSVGQWTVWQALLWGLMGLLAWRLDKAPSWIAALYGFAWGFLFGWGMNLWWFADGLAPLTLGSFITSCTISFYFDLTHAVTNAVLLIAFTKRGREFLRKMLDKGKSGQ